MFLIFSCFYFVYSTNQNEGTVERGLVRFANLAMPNTPLSNQYPELFERDKSTVFLSFLRCSELSAKNMDTVLQENVLLRKRVQELEEKLFFMISGKRAEYSTTVTVAERKQTYRHTSVSSPMFLDNRPESSIVNRRYAVTLEEKKKIDDIYAALPEIDPQYISRVLGSKHNSGSSTFVAVDGYIKSVGGNLIDYKRLYAKILRTGVRR